MQFGAVNISFHLFQSLVITDHYSDVSPWCGAPVRIVITFLWNLQAPPDAGSILSCVLGWTASKILISSEQTCKINGRGRAKPKQKAVTHSMCIRSALQSRCWEDSHAESSNKIMITCITNWREHDNWKMSAQQDDVKGIAVPHLNTSFFRSLNYRQYVSKIRGSQNVFERLRVQIYARGSVAVGLRGLESHWGRMYVHCYKQPKQSWFAPWSLDKSNLLSTNLSACECDTSPRLNRLIFCCNGIVRAAFRVCSWSYVVYLLNLQAMCGEFYKGLLSV